ncbi:MAG: 50S ribosomal protein L10 [Lachnospiraceae bacterium]|nr:50S ribosomal protein L10 [Lachnospiraceae bacterium]
MAKVELKAPVVQEISDLLSDATAAVLVDYRGITVEQDTKLRKELRENGVTYRVYKNTLLNIAMKGTAFEAMANDLNGPTAIAVTNGDATAPARVIATFDKKGEVIQLKAGVVDGTYYDQKGINAVALIPSREVLLGRLFGSMKSPITNFARVLKQIAEKDA